MSAAHDCTRSHPHEQMGKACELRTEIARLTNEGARLKAANAELINVLQAFSGANDFHEWHPKYHPAIALARAALANHPKETA